MRTSREWIDRTVAELDEPATATSAVCDIGSIPRSRPSVLGGLTLSLTLSPYEMAALDEICRADELSPKQALTHIIRARLLGQPQFGRSDRARLRACLELLRALEQHVGRAARPAMAPRQTTAAIEARAAELLELGAHLRRVGRAIGEAMLGNLSYWQGARGRDADTPAPPPRTGSSGSS